MTTAAASPRWISTRSLLVLGAALVLCFGAGQLGAVATYPNLAPWYESLNKPFFNPPNLAFPIAWSIMFALMAIALWRVVMLGQGEERRGALVAFAAQLVLNVGWSFAFFGAQSPAFGLVVVTGMLIAIAWTIVRFRRIDGAAAALLVPYIAWVAFAAVLNAAILILNS